MLAPEATVLVIDDDQTTIKLIADTLGKEFDVIFSTTAEGGLNLAKSDVKPDLILLDVLLPDYTGHDLCRRLKEDSATQKIPIIFVTSLEDIASQIKGFELGAVDYVTKPIESTLLKMRVRTHTKLHLQTMELQALAASDPLTSLANRRKFNHTLETEWSRAMRDQQFISLLNIDVDDFKQYNDNYGHGSGDDCLILISKILRNCVNRASDIVARIGGDEFAIILPSVDQNGALEVANNIINKFEELRIQHSFGGEHGHVSVSIGTATSLPSEENGYAELLTLADKAMYLAKRKGKNCINVGH